MTLGKDDNMKAIPTILIGSALLATILPASAHGMHKSKPLTMDELPPICQQYFKRAETCYNKAGNKANFARNNTKFLFQALPAADLNQRKQLCQIAMDSFAEKTRDLNCE